MFRTLLDPAHVSLQHDSNLSFFALLRKQDRSLCTATRTLVWPCCWIEPAHTQPKHTTQTQPKQLKAIHRTSHVPRTQTFSSVAQAELALRSLHCFASFLERVILASTLHVARGLYMVWPHTFFPHSTPSRLDPPNKSISCVPRQGLMFGRCAEQSPLTGYEPYDLVEVSSTEVTTMLLP